MFFVWKSKHAALVGDYARACHEILKLRAAVEALQKALENAQKNDYRDPKGKFVKAPKPAPCKKAKLTKT